jgi:hypothetical protein
MSKGSMSHDDLSFLDKSLLKYYETTGTAVHDPASYVLFNHVIMLSVAHTI